MLFLEDLKSSFGFTVLVKIWYILSIQDHRLIETSFLIANLLHKACIIVM